MNEYELGQQIARIELILENLQSRVNKIESQLINQNSSDR